MSQQTLEDTNRILHDLERKLSLGLDSSDHQSHTSHASSVVIDSDKSGMARLSIQLSVLLYIRNNDHADFDPDSVFADRQQQHITKFAREYLPSVAQDRRRQPEIDQGNEEIPDFDTTLASDDEGSTLFHASLDNLDLHDHEDYDDYDDFEDDYDGIDDDDDDMLLPPLPPRLPPREMDPDKLYGLYDFLGPDPLHCTLSRDEPVHLVNDLDNYWWLIKKMTKKERLELRQRRNENFPVFSDDEDGKIGFVPAECLETYEERLARLNCYKNEELEKTSRDTLPLEQPKDQNDLSVPGDSTESVQRSAISIVSDTQEAPLALGRTGSILKKTGSLRQSNKSVTFENLGSLVLEGDLSDNEAVDFADLYYSFSHDDLHHEHDDERQSEVLSDLYPAEVPLQINKSNRKKQDYNFQQPPAHDTSSIGSFSPDTPPVGRFHTEDDSNLTIRRSLIMDRLSRVTMDIQEQMNSDEEGGSETAFDFFNNYADSPSKEPLPEVEEEEDDAFDLDCSAEENVTPLTSVNSLNNVALSPKRSPPVVPPPEKKKTRAYTDMVSPILGKLDELTEKLAELEHSL